MSAIVGGRPSSEQNELHHLLARKLQGFDVVSEGEIQILERAVGGSRTFAVGQDLVEMGDSPHFSTLLVEGWAARYKTLANGTRQITAIHIPGDFVDLHSFLLSPMDHGMVALSTCHVAMFPHDRLRHITEEHPHLARLLWLNTLLDAAMHREWIVAMGRLPAVNHLAHLVCEVYLRLKAVGLTRGHEFDFPLRQAEVADTLGLSTVHVNRILQDIRGRGLISWQSRTVTIHDWDGLVEFAQFDPTYLHQRREPR